MNERAARAYLSHITEPADQLVGMMRDQLGAAETVTQLWHNADHKDKYRPRMTLGLDEKKITDWLFDMQDRHQVAFVTPKDADWPTGLDDLEDAAPHGLWVRGSVRFLGQLNQSPSVAIVGARAATSYGEHTAHQLASDLAVQGFIVVSGLAYGIDGAAHRAAVAAGGTTVAFMAGGVDRIYPAGHAQLGERILHNQGVIVAEVPPGSSPTRWRFMARNRLIAAASDASVVVEAGFRSGSLNEAGHAHGLGRPVGAVPGPVTSAASAGCHRIIREGVGVLVTSTEEVKELLGIRRAEKQEQPAEPLTAPSGEW